MLVNRLILQFSVQLNDKFTFAFLAFSTNVEAVRGEILVHLLLLFGERCGFHW